jgi:hypothetical protein
MKHADFRIGCEFLTGSGHWRCTDVGARTIAAIRLNHDDDHRWYNGPPYAVVEHVFDEEGIQGCDKAPKRRTYDDSGRSEVTIVSGPRTETPRIEKSRRAGGAKGT